MFNRSGATLVEMMVAVILASIVMMGLVTAYLFGLDAWDRTAKKSVLNESGSALMYTLTRDIQRADSVEILNGGKDLFLRIRPFSDTVPQHFLSYSIEEDKLYRDSNGVKNVVLPLYKNDSVGILLIDAKPFFRLNREVPLTRYDKVIDISFQLRLKTGKIEEETEFESTVTARNCSL